MRNLTGLEQSVESSREEVPLVQSVCPYCDKVFQEKLLLKQHLDQASATTMLLYTMSI